MRSFLLPKDRRDDIVLGKFFLSLRDLPVGTDSSASYFKSLSGKNLDGSSFLVPRSFGYYVGANKQLEQCFNSGNYSAFVTVTESSKTSFVERMIFEHQGQVNNYTSQGLKQIVKYASKEKEKPKQ